LTNGTNVHYQLKEKHYIIEGEHYKIIKIAILQQNLVSAQFNKEMWRFIGIAYARGNNIVYM